MNLKNSTYEDLWKGDFDKDGTPNIDDKRPFNKNIKTKVNPEVSLKQAYENVELRRNQYSEDIEKLKKKLKTFNLKHRKFQLQVLFSIP